MDFTTLAKVTYSDQRILTTEQLTEFYGCKVQQIKQNFNNNKEHFIEGKHYFKLEGEILKEFKSLVENFDLPINKFAPVLYLWTKYGAARHAKMLSTDKAWEVFEKLEEAYFESKEKTSSAPNVENEVAVENPVEVQNPVVVQDKPFPKYHEIIADIDKSATLLNKCLGLDYEISFVTVAETIEDNHELNLTRIKNLLPAAKR